LTLYISDQADEFRIEISGRFADSAVSDAATAWRAALSLKTPRRISVDITRMTGYDPAGYQLLRDIYSHGTHVVAGTPRSLLFFSQISASRPVLTSITGDSSRGKRNASRQIAGMHRAAAAGE
jgi:hypothetical protein